MSNRRLWPFLAVSQIVVLLALLNYYFNPVKFSTQCEIGNASSSQIGTGKIIDCVACLNLDSRDLLPTKLMADISVIIPTKINENNSAQNRQIQTSLSKQSQNLMQTKFMFLGQVFGQKGCSQYKCSSLLYNDDFKLVQNDHYNYLKEHQITHISSVDFIKYFNSLKVLTFTGKPELSYRKVSSTAIIGDYSSLAVRFRYNVRPQIEQKSPEFLLFQIVDSIFLRFLLLTPLLLEIFTLKKLILQKWGHCLGWIFISLLPLSFLSQNILVIISAMTINLIIVGIAKKILEGWFLSIGIIVAKIAFHFEYITFPLVCVVISGIIPFVFNHLKEKQSYTGHVIVLMSGDLIIGSVFSWTFLAYAVPLLILEFILLSMPQQEKKDLKQYRNVQQLQQEEDVLVNVTNISRR